MRIKKQSTLKWDNAPDVITPDDLVKITGLGIQTCRRLFDTPGFPAFPKELIGNVGKADKEAVRLYLQGFNVKNNDKNTLLMLIYKELHNLNTRDSEKNQKNDIQENNEEIDIEM